MNWRKDPIHPKHYFGRYTVWKLNDRKRTNVSWLVEHDGEPISNERQLRDAKAFVEANARLIAAAPTMHDLLMRAADASEALDGTNVENEKLVDDYRAWRAQNTAQPADVRAGSPTT